MLLDGLFEQESNDKYARYKLTLLKKLSQSTRPTKIKERTDDLAYIAALYKSLEFVLPVLNLVVSGEAHQQFHHLDQPLARGNVVYHQSG